MEEKEKKLELPMVNDECPVCKKDEGRCGAEVISQLKEEGKLGKEAFPMGLVLQIPLMDMTKATTLLVGNIIKVPTISIYFDVCKKCKVLYCIKFDLVYQDMPVQFRQVGMPQQGGEGLPPGFGL